MDEDAPNSYCGQDITCTSPTTVIASPTLMTSSPNTTTTSNPTAMTVQSIIMTSSPTAMTVQSIIMTSSPTAMTTSSNAITSNPTATTVSSTSVISSTTVTTTIHTAPATAGTIPTSGPIAMTTDTAAVTTDTAAMTTTPMPGNVSDDRGSLVEVMCEHSPSPSPHLDDEKSCESDFDKPTLDELRSVGSGDGEPTYLALLSSQVDPLEDVELKFTCRSSGDENPYDNDDLFDPEFLERVRKNYRLKRLRKKLEKQLTLDDDSAEEIRPRTRQAVPPPKQDILPCFTCNGGKITTEEMNPSESDLDFLMKKRMACPLPDYTTGRNPKDPLPRIMDQKVTTGKLLNKANTLMAMPYVTSASDSDNSTDYEEIADCLPAGQSAADVGRERLGTSPARLVQALGLSPVMRSRTQRVANFMKRRQKRKKLSKIPTKDGHVAPSAASERALRSSNSTDAGINRSCDDTTKSHDQRSPKANGDSFDVSDTSYLQKLQTFEELLELYGTVKTHLQTQTPEQATACSMDKFSPESSLDLPRLRRSPVLGRSIKLPFTCKDTRMARTPSPSHTHGTNVNNTDSVRTASTLPRHMQKLVAQSSLDSTVTDEVKKMQLKRIRTVLLSSK